MLFFFKRKKVNLILREEKNEPITCFHRVGIVAKYSYIVIVKAIDKDFRIKERKDARKKNRTINFLMFFHI